MLQAFSMLKLDTYLLGPFPNLNKNLPLNKNRPFNLEKLSISHSAYLTTFLWQFGFGILNVKAKLIGFPTNSFRCTLSVVREIKSGNARKKRSFGLYTAERDLQRPQVLHLVKVLTDNCTLNWLSHTF